MREYLSNFTLKMTEEGSRPGEEEEYQTGPVSSGKDKETKESVPRGRLWFVRNLT